MSPKLPPITKTAPAPDIGRAIPTINPALLSPPDKKKLWAGLKRDNPPLAEMLTNDQTIKDLKAHFGAFILFEEDEANQYLKEQP